jgi:hypothetical protein
MAKLSVAGYSLDEVRVYAYGEPDFRFLWSACYRINFGKYALVKKSVEYLVGTGI